MNLLTPEFVKKIYCSSPQRDDFEVENLLENEEASKSFLSRKQNKGFAVDAFIRPPVTIYIVFKQEVSIESIQLDAKVNTQVSNGFLISTSIDSPQLIEQSIQEKRADAVNFQQIAKILNEKNKACHVYEFTRRMSSQSNSNNNSSSQFVYVAHFGARSSLYLDKVTGVSICITRTLNSANACLRSVKVFRRLFQPDAGEAVQSESETCLPTKNKSTPEKSDLVEIPIEFVDELTHEIMKMPIKLPSSKYIDKTTLDKYLAEEKLNNMNHQAAKDPFTRVAFTANYKPLIDETLKSKIDRFLFDNQGKRLAYKSESPCKLRKKSVEKIVTREDLKRNLSLISMDYFKNNELENDSTPTNSKKLKQSPQQSCCCCLNLKNPQLGFYELQTCKHVYCRNCLVSLNRKCLVCKVSFKSSQVINVDRAHFDTSQASSNL
jgi:hypothetical protein